MNIKQSYLIIGILIVIGFSAATAVVVHHHDKVANDHAMMASEAMQKTEISKAATDAAMKQQETDKMTVHDAMLHTTKTSTPTMAH